MKRILWELEYQALPPVRKHCKKCGGKTEFICSGQFRINAQRKSLDIWLIYKCGNCDATWNSEIYSRVSPQSVDPGLLEGFHRNDETLAEQYAMDYELLHRNGVEAGAPDYSVTGDPGPEDEAFQVEIRTRYRLPVKVSALVRGKLRISQRQYSELVLEGKIRSIPEQDLLKCRLNQGIVLVVSQGVWEPFYKKIK